MFECSEGVDCSVLSQIFFFSSQEGKHQLPVALQADSHNT